LNRKQYIQSRGATCRNWTWSWSFINHDELQVIFGAWDTEREKERVVILRQEWEYSSRDKKPPGYTQAIEHIGILQGYELFTFNMESMKKETVFKIVVRHEAVPVIVSANR
jgi:5-methylcytosine-specific restriction protein A